MPDPFAPLTESQRGELFRRFWLPEPQRPTDQTSCLPVAPADELNIADRRV
jgi:hypothetical protein